MSSSAPRPSVRFGIAQWVLAALCIGAMPLMPRPAGPVLLLPLDGRGAGALVSTALRLGALPVAAGPLAGSLVVMPTRSIAWGPLLADGIVALSAPDAICGGAAAGR